jgi:hypothetical protein
MEMTTRFSEATQASAKRVQAAPTGLDAESVRISRLAEYAMDAPESRRKIVAVLVEFEQNSDDLRTAMAAHRAISSILAVSMLEALQE